MKGCGVVRRNQEEGGRRAGLQTLGHVGYVHTLDCSDGSKGAYIYQNIKLYTLNMYSLLYVNSTFMKLLKNNFE